MPRHFFVAPLNSIPLSGIFGDPDHYEGVEEADGVVSAPSLSYFQNYGNDTYKTRSKE